ncbi:hypothetical protein [Shinella sp.]|uniref:hypothetical protein n=1 Tax=Shinella sp. TaxID=1870904 RepID=UPI00403747FA
MIEFVILNEDQPDATLLECVRVMIKHDLKGCYYDAEPRVFTPAEVEGLWKKVVRMKDDEGNVVHVAPMGMSEKVKEEPDCVPGFIKGWFGHPLSELVRMQIARQRDQ